MVGSLFRYFVIFQPGHDFERKGVSSFIYCALIACFVFAAFGGLFFRNKECFNLLFIGLPLAFFLLNAVLSGPTLFI